MSSFSIIMPNFNGEKYIERSIRSIIASNDLSVEVLVVDGKSTDGSHEILTSLCKLFDQSKLKWIQEPDTGISSAINIGLKHAAKDIVGYAGSDDLFLPDAFKQIQFVFDNLSPDFVFTDSIAYQVSKGQTKIHRCRSEMFTAESLLQFGTPVGLQNIFFKRPLITRLGYDETNRYSMDYELYFRLIKEGVKGFHLPICSTINVFDGNISTDADGKQFAESQGVVLKHKGGYQGPCYFFPEKPSLKTKILGKIGKALKA